MTKSKARKLSKEFAGIAMSVTQEQLEQAIFLLIEETIRDTFNRVARHMDINAANPKLAHKEIYEALARLYRRHAPNPFGASDVVIQDQTNIVM